MLWLCVLSLHALPTVIGLNMVRRNKKPATPEVCGFWFEALEALGLPGGTRTPDLLLRRQLLYPVELRAVAGPVRAARSEIIMARWGFHAAL